MDTRQIDALLTARSKATEARLARGLSRDDVRRLEEQAIAMDLGGDYRILLDAERRHGATGMESEPTAENNERAHMRLLVRAWTARGLLA